jgi:hypothetical protein
MTLIEYFGGASSSYVIPAGTRPGDATLTVESYHSASNTWSAADAETAAIERNAPFHTTIVDRLAAGAGQLVDADDLL